MRKGKALTVTAAAVAVLSLAACGASSSSSSSASASPAALVHAWATGPGQQKMSAVNADLAVIAGHASSYMAADLPADGARLAKDAISAEGDPLPCDTADYSSAMRLLASAGADLAGGDAATATEEIRQADAPLQRALAAMRQVMKP